MSNNNDIDGMVTPSQVAAWYHRQILRIPHGDQNPSKRYLDDGAVLELFDGTVVIQEKVDGKMTWENVGKSLIIVEDMTGKNTVHKHVMEYKNLPANKRIVLDMVRINDNFSDVGKRFKIVSAIPDYLNYAVLMMDKPCIFHIQQVMRALSHSPSHFGSHLIEGLVAKNYSKGLFGKWVNDEFEDKL